MATTGLLVRACTDLATRGECDQKMDHVSASWMSDPLTGFRPFPGSLVGAIVDPGRVNILCAYPTDAASDGRDGRGCGPMSIDPQKGSQGYERASDAQKAAFRASVAEWYASINATSWRDAPCSRAWNGAAKGLVGYSALGNLSEAIRPYFWYWNRFYGPFLDDVPYCLDDAVPCARLGECGVLLSVGDTSWPPARFAEVIDAQRALHDRHPALLEASWNEVVFEPKEGTNNPRPSYDSAVFWLNDTRASADALRTARARALELGLAAEGRGLPVLVGNLPWLKSDAPLTERAPWGFEVDDDAADRRPAGVVFSCDLVV